MALKENDVWIRKLHLVTTKLFIFKLRNVAHNILKKLKTHKHQQKRSHFFVILEINTFLNHRDLRMLEPLM